MQNIQAVLKRGEQVWAVRRCTHAQRSFVSFCAPQPHTRAGARTHAGAQSHTVAHACAHAHARTLISHGRRVTWPPSATAAHTRPHAHTATRTWPRAHSATRAHSHAHTAAHKATHTRLRDGVRDGQVGQLLERTDSLVASSSQFKMQSNR